MNTPFISLAALTVLELPPDALVEVAAQAGYQGVGIRLVPATEEEDHFSLMHDKALAQRTETLLRETGVKVTDIEILRLQPDTNVADFLPVFEYGAKLGATNVLLAGNDNNNSRMTNNFIAACELAKPFGLFPHLEFMPWTDVKNLNQAKVIVAAARNSGCDNACLLVDSFHFDRSHSHLVDLKKIPASWMKYVQLCDAQGPPPIDMDDVLMQARYEREFLGAGDIDLVNLVKALPNDVMYSLEIPKHALQQQGVSALERATLALKSAQQLLALASQVVS